MRQNPFCDSRRNHTAQSFYPSALQVGDAAEFAQQLLNRSRADSGDIAKRGLGLPLAATLAMEGHREAMCFVANLLNQMQHRRMAIENAGLVFLAENVKNLFLFRDAGHRLIDDLQGVQGLRRSMQLTYSAV